MPTDRPAGTGTPAGDLSLRDAALLYAVALRTLRTRVRCGQIPGYKVRGIRGHEWRVSRDALDISGLAARPAVTTAAGERPGRVAALELELELARLALRAESARADRADQELGFALLECGRLRAALRRAESMLGSTVAARP
ncbi:helix-turn-helix domain-containing protein [Cellulomonas aerilata]|uniref:Helix-turn-helix domain-containing protein n=1 Tax=Cellulomonas aerilata TaxID=515326 RepID=A0A512DDD0_9CELL|nr:helix-turn-helix domain-containing protein [Cellulomonas aerilata]GEO34484.1 hypothetical protein CAE01nite_22090 [Cellulomonas aerilata]